MRKLSVLAVAAALILTAGVANAKDMKGKFGVGGQQTLGGVTGLGLSYWVTNALGIDVTLGVDYTSPDEGDSRMGFNAAIGARYNIARAKDVNLGLGLILDLGFANKELAGTEDSLFQVNIELPLTVEYFFSEHFAINMGVGLTFIIVPEDGQALRPNGRTGAGNYNGKDFGFIFGDTVGAFGEAGFRFYF